MFDRLSLAWKLLVGKAALRGGAGPGFSSGYGSNGDLPRRGTLELLQAYKTMPWLRTAAGRIASHVASVPLTLSVPGRKGGKPRELEEHELLDLLQKPNPRMRGRAFRRLLQVWLEAPGEAFAVKERNAAGVPVELYAIPPHRVVQTPGPVRNTFRVIMPNGQHRELPPEDVIWLKDTDPENPYGRGSGIGAALNDELNTDEFAAQQAASVLANGAIPSHILGVEGMAEDEAIRLKAKMEEDFGG
ncbi:MAG: phage portal protein, partial [Myxococcales bacterium]